MIQIEYLPIVLTGIGIMASILYYASVLRNQNTSRQAQLFQHVYDNWMSPELYDAWKLLRPFEFKDYGHFLTFWESYLDDTPEHLAMSKLIAYYEGVGVYVKEGLISIRLVALLMTGMTTTFYRKLLPYAERYRKETGNHWFAIETEHLYNELMRYIEENPDFRTMTR